jgi:glutamyl-tRNA synthetase
VDDLAGRIATHLSRVGVLPAEPTAQQLAMVRAATPHVSERMAVLSEAEGMLGFLFVDDDAFTIEPESAAAVLKGNAGEVLTAAVAALEPLDDWSTAAIETALRSALVEGLGLKPKLAFGPVRVAATGRRISPPLFESIELLGRDRALRRLRAATSQVA